MINLDRLFDKEEKILIVPNEMKSYFLEYRKTYPRTHFKLFTINELFKELIGNFFSKGAIKFGLNYFKDKNYTYNSIKEINEVVFKSCHLENGTKDLQDYEKALIQNKFKVFNDDLLLLLKSRQIIVVGLEDSSTLKSLFNKYEILNVQFVDIESVIEIDLKKNYFQFFNIGETCFFSLNNILSIVEATNEPADIYVYLDTNRFDYYLTNYLQGVKIPYHIGGKDSLIYTKTFKYILSNFNEETNAIDLLKAGKEELSDDENYESILSVLEFFDIDHLTNKRNNLIEILKSQSKEMYQYTNDLQFANNLIFSSSKDIFILGFDQNLMPSNIKDVGLISYKLREKLGLDSLNEANLMKVKLEEAFVKQASVKNIYYHYKDNSGQNSESYFVKLFDAEEAPPVEHIKYEVDENGDENIVVTEYSELLAKLYYRLGIDEYLNRGIFSDRTIMYLNYYNKELLPTFSQHFKHFSDFKLDKPLRYSYTGLESYNKCPFAFYCENILKLGIFEETIYTKFGNIAHKILEKIYDENFDFNYEKNEALKHVQKDEPLSNKEKMLLTRFLEEVENSAKRILEHKKNMSYKTSYSEQSFNQTYKIDRKNYTFNDGKVKVNKKTENVLFTGKIDRIIETSDDSLYLIDYKTGEAAFSKTGFLNKHTSSQLPTYLSILDNCKEKEFKDKVVAGMYIQPIVVRKARFYNFHNPSQKDEDSVKLQGRILDDLDRAKKFDYSILNGDKSLFVDGLELSKKGTLSRKSQKVDSNEDFVKYEEEFIKFLSSVSSNVNKGNFDIWPLSKRTGSSSDSPCGYCKYKDICLTNFEDNNQDE